MKVLSRAGPRWVLHIGWLSLPPVFLLVCMPAGGWSTIRWPAWIGLFGLVIVNVAILSIPLIFIRTKWVQRVVFLPLLAIALFSLSYAIKNGASPGPAVLVAVLRTNLREFAEILPGLLSAYAPAWLLFVGLAWWVWQLPGATQPANKAIRVVAVNLAIWLANGFLAAWAFWPQAYARFVPAGAEYAIFPGNVLFTAYNAFQTDVHDYLSEEQQAFQFHASSGEPALPLRVVLVIGESSTAERWQLAGYQRATNPRLTHLSSGELVFFPDVLAGGTSTRSTVPLILTRATPMDFGRASRERSVVSAFAESGYATGWISNQDRFPYSQEADSETYINPDWSVGNGRYDEDLLPLVHRQLEKRDHLFLAIHTMGSHLQYRYRVPESERFFGRRPGAGLLDDYDDTIRYTDRFLVDLIDLLTRVDDVPSVLLYVSDHGQDLARAAEGELSQGLADFPRSLVHVPLIVWMSPRYVQAWPAVAAALTQNRDCPHSQIEVFQTLVTLGHIKLPNPGPSLLDVDCHRPRAVMAGARIVRFE